MNSKKFFPTANSRTVDSSLEPRPSPKGGGLDLRLMTHCLVKARIAQSTVHVAKQIVGI